jgi:hypothetical protein
VLLRFGDALLPPLHGRADLLLVDLSQRHPRRPPPLLNMPTPLFSGTQPIPYSICNRSVNHQSVTNQPIYLNHSVLNL